MKKTIAKIMAAAMVLSTVVAPNVNASMAISATDGAVNFNSLQLSQVAATLSGNVNNHDLLSSSTIGSRNNPVDAGFSVNYNSAGNISSVDTDLYLTGTTAELDGNLIYFDTATDNISVSVSDAAVTAANVNYWEDNNGTETADIVAADLGIDTKQSSETQTAYLKRIVKTLKSGDANVTSIGNVLSNSGSGSALADNVLKTTVSNGIFDEDKYIGATVFDGGFTINNNGSFRFVVGSPNSTKTAQILAAADSTDPIVFKMTLQFKGKATDADGVKIPDKQVWVRLASQEEADYDGFVILHEDNGYNRHIGVNYSVDSSGYAEITKANTKVLNSDVAKGGRLYLDYVYNRTNTSANTAVNAYKIRTIGSRVFKDGKFQAISGLGDDGAKWIRTIRNGAFRSCKQLKKVNLDTEKKIRKINAKAFKGDKKLATVKLDGRNLKQIGSKAFDGTKSNITFKIKGNASQFKKAKAKIAKQAPKKAKFSRL